jgi:hypothetical protein
LSDTLKTILFFAALLAGLTWIFSTILGPDTSGVRRLNEGTIQYFGPIDSERVDKFKSLYRSGDRLLISSNGGSIYAGIDMGTFIHQKSMTVEVADLCISSCANYVFLAGETKVLNKHSLVVFHGGPKQANFLSLLEQADSSNAAPGTTFGRADYEGVVTIESAAAQRMARAENYGSRCELGEYLDQYGHCQTITPKQSLTYITDMEEQFYNTVNPNMSKNIPYLGQLGEYEATYLAYEYYGFFYSIESLANLNVSNVYTKEGEWSPQENALFNKVYEVLIND